VARLVGVGQPPGPERVAVIQRGRVLPALPEGQVQVAHGRAAHLQLGVVPSGTGAKARVELDRLGITQMALVVAAAVAQVDPADEGHVVVLAPAVAQHHQLLVLGARAPHPLVEHDLPTGLVDDLAQVQVLLLAEVGARWVGAPQQPAHVHAAFGQVGERRAELGAAVIKQLVRVAAPVTEADLVAGAEPLELGQQPAEVGHAMHDRHDQVALGPSPAVTAAPVDLGGRVAPPRRAQEPVAGLDRRLHPPATSHR
jgi:hypothetical protein